MLSDNAINNLMQPIIDRQEAINRYILKKIADVIKEFGSITPSQVQQLVRLLKSGNDVRKINKELARLTGLQVKDVKNIIRDVAQSSYHDAKPFYDYRLKPFIQFDKNLALQKVVKAVSDVTEETFKNISNTQATGFLIRDLKNPRLLKWHTISETYETVIDEAAQAVQSGVVDYNTAMRRTMDQLINSGVRRITYSPESGRRYTKRLDSAVRMNLSDAVRAVAQATQDEIGKQIDADGKEVSVHMMPAPDHALIQGHQFDLKQWEILQSQDDSKEARTAKNKYTKKSYTISVPHRCIGIWNCRHIAFSIILGAMQPNYTQKELDEILRKNKEGVVIGGKHYTGYEAIQKQRQMETLVRYAKDGQMVSLSAGDMESAQRYQNKVDRYTKDYKQFSNLAGLKTQPNRLRVEGYTKINF